VASNAAAVMTYLRFIVYSWVVPSAR
jgi:hypothetical protein